MGNGKPAPGFAGCTRMVWASIIFAGGSHETVEGNKGLEPSLDTIGDNGQ